MKWTQRVEQLVKEDGIVVRAVIVETHGPTPRAPGAALYVTPRRREGRIGRPATMEAVAATAQEMVGAYEARPTNWLRVMESYATGDVLGESTGGHVQVLFEAFGATEAEVLSAIVASQGGKAGLALVREVRSGSPPRVANIGDARAERSKGHSNASVESEVLGALASSRSLHAALSGDRAVVAERLQPELIPFHVYGTGLVARALVELLAGLPFDVVWHDRAPSHFPKVVPAGVAIGTTQHPAEAAASAQAGSFHAVMTGDHAEDLAVCLAVALGREFGYLGVIGAPLKRERLTARLSEVGVQPDVIERIACPIGLSGIRSKDPAVIAVSIAAQALTALGQMRRVP